MGHWCCWPRSSNARRYFVFSAVLLNWVTSISTREWREGNRLDGSPDFYYSKASPVPCSAYDGRVGRGYQRGSATCKSVLKRMAGASYSCAYMQIRERRRGRRSCTPAAWSARGKNTTSVVLYIWKLKHRQVQSATSRFANSRFPLIKRHSFQAGAQAWATFCIGSRFCPNRNTQDYVFSLCIYMARIHSFLFVTFSFLFALGMQSWNMHWLI